MLEFVFELLFEFFGEFILQLFGELVGGAFKAGWLRLRGRESELTPMHEAGWALATGALAAGATLLIFPHLALRQPWLQGLNLLLAPVVAGLLVERLRAWRERRSGFRGAVFGYAALFGIAFAGTRWIFGR